jgi:hypothetical protein
MDPTREIVWERDQGQCARCGVNLQSRGWSVHHRRLGNRADNRPSNLIMLCGSGVTYCHGWVHHNRTAAAEAGYIVSRHGPVTNTLEISVTYGQPERAGSFLLLDEADPEGKWVLAT